MVVDTLYLDTGMSVNLVQNALLEKTRTHFQGEKCGTFFMGGNMSVDQLPLCTLDHLVIAGHTFDAVPFHNIFFGPWPNLLGQSFLSQYGAVGFNFRAHQLVFYH